MAGREGRREIGRRGEKKEVRREGGRQGGKCNETARKTREGPEKMARARQEKKWVSDGVTLSGQLAIGKPLNHPHSESGGDAASLYCLPQKPLGSDQGTRE